MTHSLKTKEIIYPLLAALLCVAMSWPFMGKYFLTPNKFITAFGGDPLVIMHDIFYHVKYGSGSMLTNSSYPFGEYIYLTDAEGVLSTVLRWINHHLFNLEDYIVGIVYSINVWLLPIASIFVYLLLRAWTVDRWLSILFAPLIVVLSPQFFRLGAHFGLAYPFIIPMAMLWTLRKFRVQQWEFRDLAVLSILLLFTFNNPYVGFAASLFILSSAFVFWILKKTLTKGVLIPAILGITNLAIVFTTFLVKDPYDDRVKQQWGNFIYKSTIEGYLASPNSYVDLFFKQNFGKGFQVQFEAMQNVGAIVVLTYLAWLAVSIMRKRKTLGITWPTDFLTQFLGASLVFIYASTFLFMAFDRDWIEEKLGFLLMFKALGRISWSFYFVISIGAVILLDRFALSIKSAYIRYAFVSCLAAIWMFEIYQYTKPSFREVYNGNVLSKTELSKKADFLKENKIIADEYQAILLLPKMVYWSDKFRSMGMDWAPHFHGVQTSLVTGLPFINPFLSRVSTSNAAEAIELISNPYIEKSLLSKFKNERDILLIVGQSAPLQEGEKYLVSISDTLFTSETYSFMRLPLARINDVSKAAKNMVLVDSITQNLPTLYLSFDDQGTKNAYFSNAALSVEKGSHTIVDTLFNGEKGGYEFSAWTHIDAKKYGMGKWILQVINPDGAKVNETSIETAESYDVQDDWIRSVVTIQLEPGQRLKAILESNQTLIIDEVMLRSGQKNVIINTASSPFFLLNGIRIRK